MDRSAVRALSRLTAVVPPEGVATAPPGVTIAIPNWNHEYVLPRSVGSALQAVADLRARGVAAAVLVIDDASRDGSLTLLRQCEALYYGQGLPVVARARNGGLPLARYRTVAFTDGDNEIVPENLHRFYRALRDTVAAAVYGNLIYRSETSELTAVTSNESMQPRIYGENYVDAFALFDRMQLLDVGAYANSIEVQAREDWELYLHLAAMGRRIVLVPLVFGVYYALDNFMIEEARADHDAQKATIRRVFDQLGLRDRLPMNTRHLRYHPDVGYL